MTKIIEIMKRASGQNSNTEGGDKMRYSVQIEETGEVYACTEQQSLL